MDWHKQTIDTYNKSAKQLAEYFRGIGPRIDDIELGLKLAHADKSKARVIEVGCGDGRDALEIVKRVNWYEGFDPSTELLKLAKAKCPNVSFVLADALSYSYPQNIDVVFAFASLLHVNKSDMKTVFKEVLGSLKTGGIFYLSLKERPEYVKEVKDDEHGQRMFYYYSPSLIKTTAGAAFKTVYEDHQTIGHTDWFTLAMAKV